MEAGLALTRRIVSRTCIVNSDERNHHILPFGISLTAPFEFGSVITKHAYGLLPAWMAHV